MAEDGLWRSPRNDLEEQQNPLKPIKVPAQTLPSASVFPGHQHTELGLKITPRSQLLTVTQELNSSKTQLQNWNPLYVVLTRAS